MKAVSIRVNDVLGVAGFVLPGDRVDIMLTRSDKAVGTYTDVLLQGVKVLAIDQTADDRADKPSVARTVTFEVSTQEAQKLTLAANCWNAFARAPQCLFGRYGKGRARQCQRPWRRDDIACAAGRENSRRAGSALEGARKQGSRSRRKC